MEGMSSPQAAAQGLGKALALESSLLLRPGAGRGGGAHKFRSLMVQSLPESVALLSKIFQPSL